MHFLWCYFVECTLNRSKCIYLDRQNLNSQVGVRYGKHYAFCRFVYDYNAVKFDIFYNVCLRFCYTGILIDIAFCLVYNFLIICSFNNKYLRISFPHCTEIVLHCEIKTEVCTEM